MKEESIQKSLDVEGLVKSHESLNGCTGHLPPTGVGAQPLVSDRAPDDHLRVFEAADSTEKYPRFQYRGNGRGWGLHCATKRKVARIVRIGVSVAGLALAYSRRCAS